MPHAFPTGLSFGMPPSFSPNPETVVKILAPQMLTTDPISGFYFRWGCKDMERIHEMPPGYIPWMYKRAHEVEPFARGWKRAWGLLNEPDVGYARRIGGEWKVTGQANLTPSQAIVEIQKARDFGVRRWFGPNVNIDPDGYGLAWLDEYVNLGGPIPEAWGIHIYPKSGEVLTPWGWDVLISDFSRWMGKRRLVRQIIVTETSAGAGTTEQQINLLNHVALRMKTHPIIQAVAWFSSYYEKDERPMASNLLHPDGKRNNIGREFSRLFSG